MHSMVCINLVACLTRNNSRVLQHHDELAVEGDGLDVVKFTLFALDRLDLRVDLVRVDRGHRERHHLDEVPGRRQARLVDQDHDEITVELGELNAGDLELLFSEPLVDHGLARTGVHLMRRQHERFGFHDQSSV